MSLINQMLRDLQQQKKPGKAQNPERLQPKVMDRIPYLPLPVVLAGAGLILLCLIWWLAGALSGLMFGFEPVEQPSASRQVIAEQPPADEVLTVAEEDVSITPDQLTLAERDAEPPSSIVDSSPTKLAAIVVNKEQAIPVVKMPVKTPVTVKTAAVSPKTSRSTVDQPRQVRTSPQAVKSQTATKTHKVAQPSRKVVASPPRRMHPDDLPGAILSNSRSLPEAKAVARPSTVRATTPYGMAEEAYLDGKWALEHERANLAVSSLQRALKLYSGHLAARQLLVEILDKDGKTGEAMFLLAEGLEIAPDYMAFKKRYVRLLVDQGDYDAATKVMLNGGLPTVEADPEAHVVLASLYQRLGESFLAAQTYRNLLVAWPQTGAFWVGLGSSLEGQNLPEEAVACYQKALKTKKLRQDLSRYAKKRLDLLD